MQGKSLSRLAPSGNAILNGNVLEVHSENAFVDENTPIVVIRMEGNKIIVRPMDGEGVHTDGETPRDEPDAADPDTEGAAASTPTQTPVQP